MFWDRISDVNRRVKTKEEHKELYPNEDVDSDFYERRVIDFTNVKMIQMRRKKRYIHGNIQLRGEAKQKSSKLRGLTIWGSKEQEEIYYWVCEIDGMVVAESHGDSEAGYKFVKREYEFFLQEAKEQSEKLKRKSTVEFITNYNPDTRSCVIALDGEFYELKKEVFND